MNRSVFSTVLLLSVSIGAAAAPKEGCMMSRIAGTVTFDLYEEIGDRRVVTMVEWASVPTDGSPGIRFKKTNRERHLLPEKCGAKIRKLPKNEQDLVKKLFTNDLPK